MIDIIAEADNYTGPIAPGTGGGNTTTDNAGIPKVEADTKPGTTPSESTTEVTEDLTPEGSVKKDAFAILFTKLNKTDKTKAEYIKKKVVSKKGLTLEQFAKVLLNKKIITKADKKEVKKLLKGVKASKWARSHMAALIKTGVLKKSDLKNTKKNISEEFAAKILEKLMVKSKKTKK